VGLSMEFYAGDPKRIGAAFSEIKLDKLRDGSLAHSYADLSLHLSLTDLDILSEEIGALLGNPPVRLLDSLDRRVGGTPEESEANVVSQDWVVAVSAVPPASAGELSRRWLKAVATESGEEIDPENPDAAAAVSSLLSLCREATARGTSVVFAWYL
jgi:hypothetical protein